MFKKIISLFLAAVLLFSLCSCMERGIEDPIKTKPDDGTFAMKISALEARSADDEFKNAYNDFALDMFKKSISSERNSLISPLSVYIALSMLANGAKNETLTELEELLGMETGELNNYLYDYVSKLPEGDGFKMNSANSFWYKNTDSFRVNEGFKELMSTCFNADVMGKNFSRETCDEMNEWVSDKTDGMISKLIDTIPPTAVAYLINAIAFEAEWKVKYTLGDVRDRDFHNIDGTTVSTETLHSMESEYYEDEISQGFKKPYKDGYSFAAFIPKEGTDLFEYIESLDGEKLGTMLDSFVKADVSATLPSFMYEYDIELSDILKELGVVRAFSSVESDLSGIGEHDDGNLSVSRVIHKTFIELTADGTRAAAVTAVEVECEGMITYEDLKTVDLDRPFIYMIIDDTNNIPVFIGTVTVL